MPVKNLVDILLAVILTCLCSCGSVDVEGAIQQAEADLLHGNISDAVSGCDILTDSASENVLSSTQMCRVAIIYAKISEVSNDRHYMVTATECLDKAADMSADSDSLERYIQALDIDNQNVISSIRELSDALNAPIDIYAEENDGDAANGDDESSQDHYSVQNHSDLDVVYEE